MEFHRLPSPTRQSYQEFIRSTDLTVGVYRLRRGDADPQQPHGEDELYYVIEGRARFTSLNTSVDVKRGGCLFLKSGEPHRFHDITEDLVVLVVFGPAEGSRRNPT
jgi:mannose-6-phosphate isomerase-like protein (cupin superfamily)